MAVAKPNTVYSVKKEEKKGGNTYLHNKVNQWSSSIMDCCLQSLVKLQKPFKYIGKFLATPLVKIILLKHPLKVSDEWAQKCYPQILT